MLTRLFPVITLTLLSGCTLINGEQYHNETLSAIEKANSQNADQYDSMSRQFEKQAKTMDALQKQVKKLEKKIIRFETEAIKEIRKKPEPMIVSAPKSSTPSHSITLGEIEKITLNSIDQSFDARVDTGAATSSLNAIDIEFFERNGKKWVRFHLDKESKENDEKGSSKQKTTPKVAEEKNNSTWIEAPILRFVKIRQSNNEELQRRAVVELWVRLGKIHEKAQFTLADRSQMNHPVLLGREFIRDIAVVDVSKKYLHTSVSGKE